MAKTDVAVKETGTALALASMFEAASFSQGTDQ